MRSKDCRHYSRRELIEIIYELEKREDRLRRKLKKAQAQLLDRSVPWPGPDPWRRWRPCCPVYLRRRTRRPSGIYTTYGSRRRGDP